MTVPTRLIGALVMWAALVATASGQDAPPAGQAPGPAPAPAATADAADKPYVIALPVVYYTPETRLAFGGAGMYAFSLDRGTRDTRPSSLAFIAIYTQNHQSQITLKPQLYLPRDAYAMEATFEYELMPQDFYGLGPGVPATPIENFTPRSFVVAPTVRKRIRQRLFVGMQYEFARTTIVKTEPGGMIDTGAVPGSTGGTVSGLGVSLAVDTRDNVQFPRRGRHFIAAFDQFAGALGSDYSYSRTTLDYRSYRTVRERDVVAVQAILEAATGDVPFYRMAKLGGENVMRAYYKGQFRDTTMFALQAEYRAQVWKRIGATVFAGLGEVCHGLSTCSAKYVLPSVGAGFRYRLDARGGTNFRVDLAWGRSSHGVYFTVQEAF